MHGREFIKVKGVPLRSLGCLVAIASLSLGGYFGGRTLYRNLTVLPPRPVFPEELRPPDLPSATPERQAGTQSTPADRLGPPDLSPPTSDLLLPNSYLARVTWPAGLALRADPSRSSPQIGGIEMDTVILVLGPSGDGEWLQVQLLESEKKGWVRAGNVERLSQDF